MRHFGLKRAFDLSVTVGLAPIWAPMIAGIAILVRVKLGSPIFLRKGVQDLMGIFLN